MSFSILSGSMPWKTRLFFCWWLSKLPGILNLIFKSQLSIYHSQIEILLRLCIGFRALQVTFAIQAKGFNIRVTTNYHHSILATVKRKFIGNCFWSKDTLLLLHCCLNSFEKVAIKFKSLMNPLLPQSSLPIPCTYSKPPSPPHTLVSESRSRIGWLKKIVSDLVYHQDG